MAWIVQASKYRQLLPLPIETVKCSAFACHSPFFCNKMKHHCDQTTRLLPGCLLQSTHVRVFFLLPAIQEPFKFIISNRSRILRYDVLPACLPTWIVHCTAFYLASTNSFVFDTRQHSVCIILWIFRFCWLLVSPIFFHLYQTNWEVSSIVSNFQCVSLESV
jgi:hypothetical protein